MNNLVANVILPLQLTQSYSYKADQFREKIAVGMRVVVPFGGRNKFYTGIVYKLSNCTTNFELKEILMLLDDFPMVKPQQIKLWEWIANYYQCTLGEVLKAALPIGLKMESKTYISKNQTDTIPQLSIRGRNVLNAIPQTPILLEELAKKIELKQLLPTIKILQEHSLVTLSEELIPNYKDKTETFVKISDSVCVKLDDAVASLKKTPKQQQLFSTLIDLLGSSQNSLTDVSKKELLDISKCSNSVLEGLQKKAFITCFEKKVTRIKPTAAIRKPFVLNCYQQETLQKIKNEFSKKNTVLLHGITSSGKTEIYIHLINETIKKQQQVLFLVPEIALTTQLSSRLKQVFGEKVGVYHSKFSDATRVEIWQQLCVQKNYEIILGARSSIFLPFSNLGLIIVDEEHDASYKQFDPAPRYNARNSAIVLGVQYNAKVLLGTATPSIESYCNALNGKFGLVELLVRHKCIQLPLIKVVDLQQSYHRKRMRGHFSFDLLEQMQEKLAAGEQIILFQNRRGYSPYTECVQCAWSPRCPNCDVSLTYHQRFNKLTCHYCGYHEPMPELCPSCKQPTLQKKGFGTEQIEHEVHDLFPEYKVLRMDLDTTTSRKSHERLICDFESKKAQILVGTQIITKGLDFANVGLVAVLNADNLLNYPDFRAHERAFQMLTQVSGRAGRKGRQGIVIIQTSSPKHTVIRHTQTNDFKSFFTDQMIEREAFHYPPFYRLIVVEVKHKDAKKLSSAAFQLAKLFQNENCGEVLGPSNPPVSRIQNYFIKHILIKIPRHNSIDQIKVKLSTNIKIIREKQEFSQLRFNLDVDPM